jgi:DNA-directed RNA polymerase specialized sigma24 family protein
LSGPGRTAVEPALRRYLREWRQRDRDNVQQRLIDALGERPEPDPPLRVIDRLSADAEQAIVDAFMAGTPKWELAERYDLSLSSIKRLLKRHGASRRRGHGR